MIREVAPQEGFTPGFEPLRVPRLAPAA
jgi:hypothetical protein